MLLCLMIYRYIVILNLSYSFRRANSPNFCFPSLNVIVIRFQAQSKDILLFRYENPNKIFRNNIVALMIFPCYSWLSYFTYELRTELKPYKDSEVLDRKGSGWIYQATIFQATRYLGIVIFIFGK